MSCEVRTHDKERENFLYRVDCSTKNKPENRLKTEAQSHGLYSIQS